SRPSTEAHAPVAATSENESSRRAPHRTRRAYQLPGRAGFVLEAEEDRGLSGTRRPRPDRRWARAGCWGTGAGGTAPWRTPARRTTPARDPRRAAWARTGRPRTRGTVPLGSAWRSFLRSRAGLSRADSTRVRLWSTRAV